MRDTTTKPSSAVEDYLKAIYQLDERGVAVTTTALANRLSVAPSSVTSMVSRLNAMGCVRHEPYGDIGLTDSGIRLAMKVVRRRRLIELLLVECLGYGWDEVEDEAEQLEHAASEDFVERVSAMFGNPKRDPHGDPIPTANGEICASSSHLLSAVEPGAAGTLVRVWNGDPAILRYLDSCHIRLGDHIEVLDREPIAGSVEVRVCGFRESRRHTFGVSVAETLSIALD
jgi:DtxR family Mn-dependent transcriptional regulator